MVEAMEIPKGFKKTEVGIIPDDWGVKTLGEVLKIRHGKSQKEVADANGEYPILASGGQIGKAKRYLYNKPSVLIGRKGTIDVPQFMDEPFWTVDTLFYSEILEDNEPKFLYYRFLLIDWYSYNEASGVPSLNAKTIEQIQIPLPPTKAEQAAIAEALNDADALITELEKLIAKKQAIKQGAMQELLKPKEGWEVKKLGACLRSNPDYGINAAAVPYDEALPVYLRITDITEDGKYSRQNVVSVNNILSSNYYLEKDDLVFARTGASVGKTYLYDPKDGKLVFAGFLIRIRTNSEILIPEYFQFYAHTSLYWDWIRTNSTRTGQPGINGNEYSEQTITLPSKAEQTRIAQILSDMDAEIEKMEKKLDKYKMLKQGMMQNLLTGKIRLI